MGKANARQRGQDRALRAELRHDQGIQRRLGWPLCLLGAALFLVGFIGSASGAQILPFDPHHLVSQAGGFLLAVTGLVWATRP